MRGEKHRRKEEQEKIVLPKEVQKDLMDFFLRTSIPRKKRSEEEKARLSDTNDGSGT